MTTTTICPECKTESVAGTNADACPACGFKYADRGPTQIAKSNWPVANVAYIVAAAAGAVFLVGWIFA